ncbi:MAG: hypothetical protein ACP6IQ_02250 [Candidatus Njordarchaeia archaeon]
MGAPKIKIYQLPRGYAEDSDNDIQQITNDELLPVKDKNIIPEDAETLVGIEWNEQSILYSINYSFGIIEKAALQPDGAEFQHSEFNHTDILVAGEESAYSPIVYDHNLNIIPPSGYEATPSGIRFLSTPYPSGAKITYWREGPDTNTHFCTPQYPVYNGTNHMFQPILHIAPSGIIPPSGYTLVPASGLIILPSGMSDLSMDYANEKSKTKYFIGAHENWIPPNTDNESGGHLYMGPDIFKGEYDYPGDDTEDAQGNPVVQGPIPKYIEESEYQIDYRKGLVTFTNEVDSSSETVKANYACVVGVRNVTNQKLDFIGIDSNGYKYKAVTDLKYPGSIGAKWVGRRSSFFPRNIYINGILKPQVITVSPYDTLEVK